MSRRRRFIDVAEHRSMLKNYQNTLNLRFSFMPKTGVAFPKMGFCFYCNCTGDLKPTLVLDT